MKNPNLTNDVGVVVGSDETPTNRESKEKNRPPTAGRLQLRVVGDCRRILSSVTVVLDEGHIVRETILYDKHTRITINDRRGFGLGRAIVELCWNEAKLEKLVAEKTVRVQPATASPAAAGRRSVPRISTAATVYSPAAETSTSAETHRGVRSLGRRSSSNQEEATESAPTYARNDR